MPVLTEVTRELRDLIIYEQYVLNAINATPALGAFFVSHRHDSRESSAISVCSP